MSPRRSGAPRCGRLLQNGGLTLILVLLVGAVAATALAQPGDPYGDDPPAKPAPPKAPPPKPRPPAPPKSQPAKPARPAKPAPPARPAPPPSKPPAAEPADRMPRPDARRRPGRGRRPSLEDWRRRRAPTSLAPGTPHPQHGQPGGHGKPGQDAHGAEGEQGAHAKHCPGHGPEDRPPAINLFHGWLGVDNEAAPPMPEGVRAGGLPWKNWDWWSWRLTPYPWRYENDKDHCDPRNEPTPLIAPILNFAVLAFILFRLGRKPLREALKKRKVTIMREIDQAREIKDKAQDRLDRYESDLDHLDEKLAALREQYAAEAAEEKKTVVQEASEARDRMMADADFRVQQEGRAARDQLSLQAMEDALAAAEALVKERVTQADHDRLAEEYLHQIGPVLKEHGIAPGKGEGR